MPNSSATHFELVVYYKRHLRDEFQKADPGARSPGMARGGAARLPLRAARRGLRGLRGPRPSPQQPHGPRSAPPAAPPAAPRSTPRAPPPRPSRRPRPPPRAPAAPRPRRAARPRPLLRQARAALREGRLGARASQRAPRGGGGDGSGGAFQKFPCP